MVKAMSFLFLRGWDCHSRGEVRFGPIFQTYQESSKRNGRRCVGGVKLVGMVVRGLGCVCVHFEV